jgi:hypothetical protein
MSVGTSRAAVTCGAAGTLPTIVAPAAAAVARTRHTVLPSRTMSPSERACVPWTRWSFTNVPLVEPRSSIATPSPWARIAAWRRETSGSARTMSVPSRPMTASGVGSTSRPSMGACSTNTNPLNVSP